MGNVLSIAIGCHGPVEVANALHRIGVQGATIYQCVGMWEGEIEDSTVAHICWDKHIDQEGIVDGLFRAFIDQRFLYVNQIALENPYHEPRTVPS